MTDRRLATLRAALGFLRLPPTEPELRLLHRWLDTWSGVGLIGSVLAWLVSGLPSPPGALRSDSVTGPSPSGSLT